MDEILTKAVTDQEKYDNVVKEIFDQPKVVATILRLAVPEYKGMTVEEIIPYIVEISDEVPVDDISSAALRNQPQEKTALLGKVITYDKHIKARNPKAGELNITLYFDFEFQMSIGRLLSAILCLSVDGFMRHENWTVSLES